jgi:hypothetical protein
LAEIVISYAKSLKNTPWLMMKNRLWIDTGMEVHFLLNGCLKMSFAVFDWCFLLLLAIVPQVAPIKLALEIVTRD